MRSFAIVTLLLTASAAFAANGAREEDLRYQINWPGGLSLGEAHLKAMRDNGNWTYEMTIDASIPGFRVVDRYRSLTDAKGCSLRFEKETVHGARKSNETTVFDAAAKSARRSTNPGGKSDFAVPACPHDALGYLFYAREQLAKGVVPPAQKIFFGSGYDIRMQYAGTEKIMVSEAPAEAEHIKVTVKGKASAAEFHMYFARDEQRTPIMVKVPFAMGTFSMELIR